MGGREESVPPRDRLNLHVTDRNVFRSLSIMCYLQLHDSPADWESGDREVSPTGLLFFREILPRLTQTYGPNSAAEHVLASPPRRQAQGAGPPRSPAQASEPAARRPPKDAAEGRDTLLPTRASALGPRRSHWSHSSGVCVGGGRTSSNPHRGSGGRGPRAAEKVDLQLYPEPKSGPHTPVSLTPPNPP